MKISPFLCAFSSALLVCTSFAAPAFAVPTISAHSQAFGTHSGYMGAPEVETTITYTYQNYGTVAVDLTTFSKVDREDTPGVYTGVDNKTGSAPAQPESEQTIIQHFVHEALGFPDLKFYGEYQIHTSDPPTTFLAGGSGFHTY